MWTEHRNTNKSLVRETSLLDYICLWEANSLIRIASFALVRFIILQETERKHREYYLDFIVSFQRNIERLYLVIAYQPGRRFRRHGIWKGLKTVCRLYYSRWSCCCILKWRSCPVFIIMFELIVLSYQIHRLLPVSSLFVLDFTLDIGGVCCPLCC